MATFPDPRVRILAVAALVSVVLGPLGAGSTLAEGGILLPPFHVGDRATYDGPFHVEITVGAPTSTVSRDGSSVDVVPFVYVDNFTLDPIPEVDARQHMSTVYVRADSMVVEKARWTCQHIYEGECEPWEDDAWVFSGMPSAMGGTILQRRELHVGDSWTDASDCVPCKGPIVVTVGPPAPDSPTGTDLVAVLTAGEGFRSLGYGVPIGRLHLSSASPFPLRVDLDVGSYTLTDHQAGSQEITLPPRSESHFAPLASPVGFVDGLPLEGTPVPGHRSWADAMASAGAPARGAFLSVFMTEANSWVQSNGVRVNDSRTTVWESTVTLPTRDETTSYQRTDLLPDFVSLPGTWERSTSSSAPTDLGDCKTQAIPLWDAARLATRFGVLTGFSGLGLWSQHCDRFSSITFGTPHSAPGALFGSTERVELDAQTGLALSTSKWVGG